MLTSSDLQGRLEELSLKLHNSVKLDHLFNLTDHNAVLQHAKFSVPARREGYAVDDNARALVFAAKAQALWPSDRLSELQRKLLGFLLLMQSENGKLHNLMNFSQRILDKPSVGDHLGRTIWASGAVLNSSLPTGMKRTALLIFDRALPWARKSTSPRTKAYACLGLAERMRGDAKDPNLATNLRELATSLLQKYESNSVPKWEWFENILAYDNARLSQALFAAYQLLNERMYLSAAQESLDFLLKATTIGEMHVPIGSNGWYVKGGNRALYDQQAVDVGAMVETAALAYNIAKSLTYEIALRRGLGWFFGLNTKSMVVYDAATGACHDGITPEGLNENQGAESTLSFHLAAATFIENIRKSS
jgi:hypothetical protein